MAGLQGRTFGGFQLVEQLPGGGIAEVYRANPTRPGGREVVVKVIHPEFARLPGFQQQFQKSVQDTGRLAAHPHILPLVASGEESGYLYLVTPYVAAGTLRDRIQNGTLLTASDVGPFFRQLCDALGYAHSLGVVHGNVKPSNVFLFDGRHVLLGDFGLLWNVAQTDLDHAGSGADAVEYFAPEVASGQPTQQGDVYSVGAVLYASLVGHAPFQAAKLSEVLAAHARQPVPHLAQAQAAIAPPLLMLDGVVQRAMAKRPEDRYPSASAVVQAIETAIRQVPGVAAPASMQPFPPGFLPGSSSFAPPSIPAFPQAVPAPPAAMPGYPGLSGPFAPSAPLPGTGGISALGRLDPPFPPLGASATVEGEMEVGHGLPGTGAVGSTALPTDASAPGNDIPLQPTLRVPAPAPAAGGLAGPDAPAAESPWAGLLEDVEDAPPVQRMPAIRRPGTAPAGLHSTGAPRGRPGFTVAGGSAALPGTPGSRSLEGIEGAERDGEDPFAEFASAGPQPGSGDLPGGESADWPSQRSGKLPAVRGDEHVRASGDAGPSAPPDGLPRLTSPALRGMPPSWQELVSGPLEGYGSDYDDQHNGHGGSTRDGSAPLLPWRTGDDDGPPSWGPEAGSSWQGSPGDGWGRSLPGSRPLPAVPDGRVAMYNMDDPWDGARSGIAEAPSFLERQPAARPSAEDDPDNYQAFDDDRVWTQGLTAVRRKRRHWVRRLTLLLILVLLADLLMVVVARPDLCPTASCRDLHTTLVRRIPYLARSNTSAPAVLAARPETLGLTVASGKSASATLTIMNSSAGSVSWRDSVGLSWLKVDHAGGTLAKGASTQLTVTAAPSGVKPGTYTSAITLVAGSTTLTIPATIVVT